MGRTIVIGDVHGCSDELAELVSKIGVTSSDRVVFVGDLVARGPDSRGVLAIARRLSATVVRGNHEHKLLRHRATGEPLSAMHQRVASSLSARDWADLEAMPFYADLPEHGLRVVHGGVDPAKPLERQDPEALLTLRTIIDGRPSDKHGDTLWGALWRGPTHIAFGHNAQREPQLHPFATGLDTGCVYGGRLTALVLRDREAVPDVAHRELSLVSVPAHREHVRYA